MITTQIEIARPPPEVRKTFFDFESYPSWHSGLIKSLSPLSAETDALSPSQKIHCEFDDFTFDAVITENTPSKFQWQGPPVKGVSGVHTFLFEESKTTPGATTFTQFEEFSGAPAFLLQPWLLGRAIKKQFEKFNADLKKKAESVGE